jgi:enterochelin esterase-like enzyme
MGAGGAGGAGGGVVDPGTEGDGDFTINSPFTPAPENTVGNGVPRGTMQSFMLASSASTIYPSNVANGQTFNRQVQVYLPNGYVSGTESPFMIVQDGSSYLGRLRPVLDNMIADGRLPKMIGIFINPGPGDGPGSQRGLEYDTVSDTYVRFIESEILPKVAADYGARFTANPEGRASFGCSSGGAAAFTMGWFRPDLYRRIITYSGTFTNQASSTMYPHGAWEYHENLIPDNDPKPLRVFLEVGSNDTARPPRRAAFATGCSPIRAWRVSSRRRAITTASSSRTAPATATATPSPRHSPKPWRGPGAGIRADRRLVAKGRTADRRRPSNGARFPKLRAERRGRFSFQLAAAWRLHGERSRLETPETAPSLGARRTACAHYCDPRDFPRS